MKAEKTIRANEDSAIGLAHRNIDVLTRHRKKLLEELYVTEFDNSRMCIGDAYFALDIAFLRAIHAEAGRAISFLDSV